MLFLDVVEAAADQVGELLLGLFVLIYKFLAHPLVEHEESYANDREGVA